MRRIAIVGCLSLAALAGSAGTAAAATLTPSSATFGDQAAGTVSAPKTFTVTAEAPDTVLPLTVTTTGPFQQTSNCPASIGFLTTSSCTVNVRFAPQSAGTKAGTLSTTTLVLGGPSASLLGTATVGNTGAKKCKKAKKKKKGKKHSAASAKKHKKHKKKCKKKKKKKHKKH
jgi:hypothetical protein